MKTKTPNTEAAIDTILSTAEELVLFLCHLHGDDPNYAVAESSVYWSLMQSCKLSLEDWYRVKLLLLTRDKVELAQHNGTQEMFLRPIVRPEERL